MTSLSKYTEVQKQAAREACFADCSKGVHLDPENGCCSICKSPDECQGWVPYLSDAAREQCETCCGNGEIITDWERYLEPRKGDVGDEAVTECPDCSGYGSTPPPEEIGTEAS